MCQHRRCLHDTLVNWFCAAAVVGVVNYVARQPEMSDNPVFIWGAGAMWGILFSWAVLIGHDWIGSKKGPHSLDLLKEATDCERAALDNDVSHPYRAGINAGRAEVLRRWSDDIAYPHHSVSDNASRGTATNLSEGPVRLNGRNPRLSGSKPPANPVGQGR
jgi:hypothetical protein